MKVLTVGSAMIDTIAVVASDRIEQVSMRNADTSFLLLQEGSKTDAVEVSTHCGGGAINAAVSFARLGHEVATVVKVGHDQRAEMITEKLATEGISSHWLAVDQSVPTGASVMISSHERNAAIFTYRGANTRLEAADLDEAAFGADVLYIASLSNKSADLFPGLVERGKRRGAVVAANPGLRQLSSRGPTLLDTVSSIDILIINRVEAEALVAPLVARHGDPDCDERPWEPGGEMGPEGLWPAQVRRPLSGGGFVMSVPAFMTRLVREGTRRVVLTFGSHGALLGLEGEILYCPALNLPSAGTAGAGDAFGSTVTAALASGAGPELAMQLAAVNAASVVGFVDTQTGLLQADDLEHKRQEHADRLVVRRWRQPVG